jgi:hypothetical protein
MDECDNQDGGLPSAWVMMAPSTEFANLNFNFPSKIIT